MVDTAFLTDDGLLLFDQIKKWVRSNPQAFQAAGRSLDDSKDGFSDAGIRHRDARLKYRYYLQGRQKRLKNTEFCTRAGWRKQVGKHGVPPGGKRDTGPDGRYHRVPQPKCERFRLAWSETLKNLRDRPLDRRVQDDRLAMATLVLLLTWLQVDPDADTFTPLLTEFQDWLWEGNLNVLGYAGAGELALRAPAGVPIPTADRLVCRDCMRQDLLDKDWEEWSRHLRHAVGVVSQFPLAGPEDAVGVHHGSDLRPAKWFSDRTDEALYPNLLRGACKRDDITGEKLNGRWRYSVASVQCAYPQYADRLHD